MVLGGEQGLGKPETAFRAPAHFRTGSYNFLCLSFLFSKSWKGLEGWRVKGSYCLLATVSVWDDETALE